MNTLPLVFAFVIMIALTSYAIFQDYASCKWEEINYSSFMRTHRKLETSLEKKQFRAYKGKLSKASKPQESPTKKEIAYLSPRNKITLHPLSKLNLLPLIESGPFPQSEELYETAARLIRLLYQNSSLYKTDLEYRVLDLIIEGGKKEKQLHSESITAFVLQKEESLYKIFKGTKSYVPLTNKGYPPLFDFITFETLKNKKPVHFHYATMPLLLALLGSEITTMVEKMEKEKWEKDHKHATLTAQELEPLIIKEQAKGKLKGIEHFIDYSQKGEANPNITVIDSSSGITLKSHL